MAEALSKRDTEEKQQASSQASGGATVLIMCGEKDPFIIASELEKDSSFVLGGTEHLLFVTTPGVGHELPITHSREVVDTIRNFWEHNSRAF